MKRILAAAYILATYAVATALIGGGYLYAGLARNDSAIVCLGIVLVVGMTAVCALGVRAAWADRGPQKENDDDARD